MNLPTIDVIDVIGDDLRDPQFAAGYLQECLDDGLDTFLVGLHGVAKANGGLSGVARASALNRESIYKALSENGNPEFRTVQALLKSLGLQLTITPAPERKAA